MKAIKHIANIILLLLSNLVLSQTVEIPDTAFRTCLINKAPSAFDANKALIIAEAQNITEALSCRGDGILSVEGLQYLTGLSNIDLSQNFITQITAFPTSDSLARLVLDDNALTELPDLSMLSALKTFQVKRNQLTSLPDLSSNGKLTQLYVQSNEISVIPDLSNLQELWSLNVSSNNIAVLPALDSLKKLAELDVADNQLTEIPSLENLSALTFLSLSKNQLSALPAVNAVNLIQTIELERNNFEVLPDFTFFPNLERAYLNNNPLTFQDLQALETIAGYDTLFPISSMNDLEVSNNYNITELKALYISTGIDLGVSDINYTWYYNGEEITSSETDLLKVLTDSTALTGNYYCELSKATFPDLVLKTTAYNVIVTPCFDPNIFTIDVTNRTCLNNSGNITISSASLLPPNFVYELVGNVSSDTQQNDNGYFTELGETSYRISGFVGECKKDINTNIEIKEETCDNVFITPDGDGVDDAYYFNDKGSVEITDKFGNKVAQFELPSLWDGNFSSKLVAPGLYYANINKGQKLIKISVVY